MNTIIHKTTRPNGVTVQIEEVVTDQGPDGMFLVRHLYSDGSEKDCKFFQVFSSAINCFNSIVELENKEAI